MQFYFIRHAQSVNNKKWAETGTVEQRSEDPELTPLGVLQAQRLAAFVAQPPRRTDLSPHDFDNPDLGGFRLTHLYCSLMVRSVMTGLIVARATGLPLVAWTDIHETGGIHHRDPETGELTGLPGHNRAFFQEHHPDLVLPETLGEEGWWNRPFEAYDVRRARAESFLAELLARHGDTDDRVAIVSHGGFYNVLMHALLSLPDNREIWFGINNTGITSIRFMPDHLAVAYTNRTEHLTPDLI